VKEITIVCSLIFFFTDIIAQGEINEQDKILYRDERTFAVLLNSNGLGVNYRYGKRIDAFRKTIFDIDLVNIKHPKEVKISTSQFYFTNRSIVYGKLIHFYNLRLGIGVQNEMFRKFDRGGISIRRYFAVGPAVGIQKPIYYILGIDEDANGIYEAQKVEKFTNDHPQTSTIIGKASYFKGFNEISFTPGAYGKLGIMFEFGKMDEVIHALDAGIVTDLFIKKIPIMAIENNNQIFFSLFVSYRFGKVINVRFKQKKTKIDEILTD
jgi:hypothetical protein